MRFCLFASAIFFSVSSFAAIELYQVEIKSSIGDGAKSKSRLILKEGEFLTYTDKAENIIEVMALDAQVGDGKNIEMNFRISRELEDGSIEILGEPKIVTSQNKKAEITVDTEGEEKVSLEVKAKKI